MNNLNAGEMGPDKLCFEDKPENCSSEGGLYTQNQASTLCPSGWSLPTVNELAAVINGLGFSASGFWDSTSNKFTSPAWLVTAEYKEESGEPIFYHETQGAMVKNPYDAASVRCVLHQ